MKQFIGSLIYLSCVVLAVVQFLSCTEDIVMHRADVPIILTAVSPDSVNITRATKEIQSTTFYAGQSIDVYITAKGNITESSYELPNPWIYTTEEAVAGRNILVPPADKGTPCYPAGDNITVDVRAFYALEGLAERAIEGEKHKVFSVQTDQTSDLNYMKSDLMFAEVKNHRKSEQAIELQFEHRMAKIVINTEGKLGVKIKKIWLKNIKPSIVYNPEDNTFGTITDDATDLLVAENSEGVTNLEGAALIPEQVISGTAFVWVETVGGSIEAKFNIINSKSFHAGKLYTLNLNIAPMNCEPGNEKILSSDEQPWDDATGTITVAAAGMSGFAFNDVEIAPYTYDGTEKKPNYLNNGIQVVDADTPLNEGEHYDLMYYSNINFGTALVLAVGKGTKYTGFTAVKSFEIQKAPFTMKYEKEGQTMSEPYAIGKVYDMNLVNKMVDNPIFSISPADQDVVNLNNDGSVTILKAGGPVTITASSDGNGNYEVGATSYSLLVTQRSVTPESGEITVKLPEKTFVYDNMRKTFIDDVSTGEEVIEVYDGSTLLTKGVDYEIKYNNNINAGTNTAEAQVWGLGDNGNGNYAAQKLAVGYYSINQLQTSIEITDANLTKILDLGNTNAYNYSFQNTIGAPQTYTCVATSNASAFAALKYEIVEGDNTIVTLNGETGLVTPKKVGGPVKIKAKITGNGNYSTAESAEILFKVEQMTFFYPYKTPSGLSSSVVSTDASMKETNCKQRLRTDWEPSYTVNLPANAIYTFELVGGGGGCDGCNGGAGGRIRATGQLSSGTVVYFYVGEGGCNEGGPYGNGWNGGGRAGRYGSSGGGGGATDIRIGGKACGYTYNYSAGTGSNSGVDNRKLVAGGGGGASNTYAKGASGGAGGSGTYQYYWVGESKPGDGSSKSHDGGGGGGGYKGGLSGQDPLNDAGSGTGGSGGSNYYDSSLFTICKDNNNIDINGASSNGPNWPDNPSGGNSVTDYYKRWNGWAIMSYRYKE